MEQKYELVTSISRTVGDVRLYRIKALKTFVNEATQTVVHAGEYGGYIESEANLDQSGTCWIGEEAMVYGNAKVYGDAQVHGRAEVYGNARVCGEAEVYGLAHIFGEAQVFGFADVCGVSMVFGNSKVYGMARVYSDMVICDDVVTR